MTRSRRAQYAPGLVGRSKPMLEIYELITKIAPARISVLIIGESGTGKELVAKAIHHGSRFSEGPFVAVNCAALPENLVESELFGHEKGAFSGAITRRAGKFEYANGGTIFLDEIGDMPISAQAKTLRVLQEKEVERIGGNKPVKIDARVVSATNKDPKKAVQDRSFREDLLYRLKGITIKMPALRDRKEDILLLVKHFIHKYASETEREMRGISRSAMDVLMDYEFPGNVRELENIIERAVVLAEGNEITIRELSELLSGRLSIEEPNDGCRVRSSELLEALRQVRLPASKGKPARPWHAALKCTNIETIHHFLKNTNGEYFSRNEFANFLSLNCNNARNKYGTAGDYLPILRDNGIVVRNDGRANKVRFRLNEEFVTRVEQD
jgi:DNA-binding NtrC family response regulator